MFRGTTPTIVFHVNSIDINLDDMSQVWATFKSQTREVTKEIGDLEIDNTKKTVTAILTQEETLQFGKCDLYCQLRLLFYDGKAFASSIKRLKVEDILKEGVIYQDEVEGGGEDGDLPGELEPEQPVY